MNVRDIMSTNVATCTPGSNLQEVASIMKDNDCGAVPVIDRNQVTGIITDRDIVIRSIAEGKNPLDLKAENCMTKNVRTVSDKTSVEDCMNMMEKDQIRRVVVTSDDGSVRGIVAQADVALKASPREAGETVREVSR